MKLVVRYSSTPPYLPMAVGDSFHDLAKVLGISASAISHAVHRNSELYKVVEVEEDPVLYPDNNGGFWYKDPDIWETVYVEG